MDSTFWLNIGMGGAVVFVVQLFLTHLKRERRACEKCRTEHYAVTREFGIIVGNHMQHEVEARDRLTEAIRSLEALMRETARHTETTRNRR